MRVFKLLSHYIILNVILASILFYFSQVYSNLSTEKDTLNVELNSLENNITSNQQKIKKLKILKKEFEDYLRSEDFRPSIENFKEYVLLSKKIDDFKELNQMKFVYKFGKKNKAEKEKFYYELTLKSEYNNIKEINKLIEYIKDMYKTKVIGISYKNQTMEYTLQILSNKF